MPSAWPRRSASSRRSSRRLTPAASLLGTTAVTRGYELPAAKADGVAMHVLDTVSEPGKPVRVRLTSAGAKRAVVVGAYIRGVPVAHSKATLEPGQPTEVVLDPGAATIGGVTRITVFEEPAADDGRADLTPVAERLVYRNPGEVLKLTATAKKADGSTPKAFVPGQQVTLDVAATTETGSPTAAVLWAAVVNKSVLTMADDKTERQMPTHFLLGGEIQHPAELEHADFLLTDHPKAETTLDLLLGTQGWRRFAEQAPGRFRQRAPAEDADRLLVAMGADQPVPRGWRADVRRVFDDYWPQYEAAAHDLETARRDDRDRSEVRAAEGTLTRANAAYDSRLSTFGRSAARLDDYYDSIVDRRYWLPATLGLLVTGIDRSARVPGGPPGRGRGTSAAGRRGGRPGHDRRVRPPGRRPDRVREQRMAADGGGRSEAIRRLRLGVGASHGRRLGREWGRGRAVIR